MDLITKLIADGLVILVVIIGAATYLLSVTHDRYQQYTRAFMAGLTAYAIGRIASLFYIQTERPFVLLGVEPRAAYLDNPGFPSDHVLFVVTITLIVWATTRNAKATIVLALLCVAVAIGRVYALVHSVADVIGGAVAAALGVAIWYRFFRKDYNTY